MILERAAVSAAELRERTGWDVKPEGACKGDVCVPLPRQADDLFEVATLAERLGMALVRDETHGLWCLGPEAGRPALSAAAPDFTLPDWRGAPFRLSSLRGQKVLMVAWAPW